MLQKIKNSSFFAKALSEKYCLIFRNNILWSSPYENIESSFFYPVKFLLKNAFYISIHLLLTESLSIPLKNSGFCSSLNKCASLWGFYNCLWGFYNCCGAFLCLSTVCGGFTLWVFKPYPNFLLIFKHLKISL